MIPVLNQRQSSELDQFTINSGLSTEAELMDNAGKKVAQYLLEKINNPFNQTFIIISGPGNNGCDGIICHFYLLKYGVSSELLICENNYKINGILNLYNIDMLTVKNYSNKYKFNSNYYYIDAIFGYGLNKPIKGIYKKIINEINIIDRTISIDIPSGIYCDTGKAYNINVKSHVTLSLGNYKIGHFFNDGLNNIRKLKKIDIGLSESKKEIYPQIIEKKDFSKLFPYVKNNTNKYAKGKVLIIAGSKGYLGACILTSLAAIRSGAGIVKVIAPISLKIEYETTLIEPIIKYYDDSIIGRSDSLYNDCILSELPWADSVIIGPGLSMAKKDANLKIKLLKSIDKPTIVDASAFQPFYLKKMNIDDLPKNSILTPHYNEFSKIFNIDIKKVIDNPIKQIDKIVEKLNGRVLILKGATSIIVNSDKKKFLIINGNKQLATAGTGDVLSGICGSVLAQGLEINRAANYSSFLHAQCANEYERKFSKKGLIATDLINLIPLVMGKYSELS